MKKLLILVLAVGLVFPAACDNRDEKAENEILNLKSKIKAITRAKARDYEQVRDLSSEKLNLEEEVARLKGQKDLSRAEFVKTPDDRKPAFRIKDDDFKIFFSGHVKNTGEVPLNNVTVKVTFCDEFGNPVVLKLTRGERETRKMEFFSIVAGMLGQDETKSFNLEIFIQNLHGGGDALKKSISQWRKSGKGVKIAILWGSDVSFIK